MREVISYGVNDIPADLAVDVMQVQNACNLSGVARTMHRATETLWELARKIGGGTDWVNQHPIIRLYLYKLATLNGLPAEIPDDTFTFVGNIAQAELERRRNAKE